MGPIQGVVHQLRLVRWTSEADQARIQNAARELESQGRQLEFVRSAVLRLIGDDSVARSCGALDDLQNWALGKVKL